MLPANEIRDLTAAANKSSAAMAATAAEVVSMERAAHGTPQSRSYLAPTINAFTAQLSAGVRQYNEMVTAAAQLVSSANGDRGARWCCHGSAIATSWPARPIVWSAGRRLSTNSAGYRAVVGQMSWLCGVDSGLGP